MKYSSARHTSKSSRSVPVKKQHGMKLRSDKKGGLDDLCEIISQRDKFISSLRTQIKRLEAVVAAKDNTIEELSERFEDVLGLGALHGWDLRLEPAFEICEDPDAENDEQGSPVGPSNSGRMPFGERECEGTITWHMNMDQDADTADQSLEVPEEQIPQGSGEHSVATSRHDMYGPEVEDSLGMVRNSTTSPVDNSRQAVEVLSPTAAGDCALEDPADNPFEVREEQNPQGSGEQTVETSRPEIYGFEEASPFNSGMVRRRDMYVPEVDDSLGTTSPVAADNSRQVVAMELEIMPQTAAGDSALEDPADNSSGIYEDPDTESLVEEQGSSVGPRVSGRMPLDMPTAKASQGKKRPYDDEDGDDLSRKNGRSSL